MSDELVKPEEQGKEEDDVEFVDYRDDVKKWMTDNNTELKDIEEAIEGLLKAFKHPSDFFDGLRKLDANTDMGRYLLEFATRFVSEYKDDDIQYRADVKNYIEHNTKKLGEAQDSARSLLNVYKYAEDFLESIILLKSSLESKDNDMARAFLDLIEKYVDAGLPPKDE